MILRVIYLTQRLKAAKKKINIMNCLSALASLREN